MKLAGVALILLCAVGCKQAFHIESDPSGAEVYIGGKYKGTTPLDCRITGPGQLSRPLEILVKKDGYLPAQAFTDWHYTWYTATFWNQTSFYLKLSKLEPEPAPDPRSKPSE